MICKGCRKPLSFSYRVGEDRWCERCVVEAGILTRAEVDLIKSKRKPEWMPPENTQPC